MYYIFIISRKSVYKYIIFYKDKVLSLFKQVFNPRLLVLISKKLVSG